MRCTAPPARPPPPRGACGSLPLWEASDAAAHGAYGATRAPPLRLFHGSSTDAAYAILHFGLRSLSGTRHEASGAIFGAGVYLTGAVAVAREFAARRGAAWGGYACTEAGAGVGGQAGREAQGSGAAAAPPADRPTTLRPIFEAEVIRAPSVAYIKEGRSVAPPVGGVPPEGCYVVVPNASHLCIVGLHIVSEWEGGGGAGEGGREGGGGGRGQCCAPWAKWAVAAALLAYVAARLGAFGGGSDGAHEEAF